MQRIHGPYRITYYTVGAGRQVAILDRYTRDTATISQEAWRYALRKYGGVIPAADVVLDRRS